MKLLQPVKFEQAYFKASLYGQTGTGKSYTGLLVALGLWKYVHALTKKKPKPIAFADTESGSDFLYDRFKKELDGAGLVVAKTRAFQDLLKIVDDAEKECFVLIIDSITHFWNELLLAFVTKHELKRISLKHWPELKKTWREFSDRYVNNNLHMIVCGRSADIWEDAEDDEGFTEIKKVGTKLKAEGELGYESNLLIEMELHRVGPKIGSRWTHRAWINKDKFDVMNFKFCDDPGFDFFLPHISKLNLGGKHKAIDLGRNSEEIFTRKDVGAEKFRQRDILLEKIQNEIYKLYSGQDKKSKLNRLKILEDVFGTNAWGEIERMSNEMLEGGLGSILSKGKEIPKEDK